MPATKEEKSATNSRNENHVNQKFSLNPAIL
jgi:hypothetical protein